MRIFLTGATGFIGGHILRALAARGHEVTCLVRKGGLPALAAEAMPGVTLIEGEFTNPVAWHERVAGHDAVINAVGIIRESPGARFSIVHTEAPLVLFELAAQAGVRKVVQISALGADEGAVSQYHLTKRRADEWLAKRGVPYVILRPSFVYGPGDQSMTFFLSLAALPVTPVPGDGTPLVQPIHVDDLVRAVVLAVERDDLANVVADAGGERAIPFDTLLDVLARRLGKPRARKLHVPWPAMRLAAAATDALGGRGPITAEELGMLRRGNHTDNRAFVRAFGFEPVPFETGIARRPLSRADVWQARLTHLLVPLRLCIAFIWLATGLISALVASEEGFELLREVGITGPLADAALYGTSAFEVLIGLATAAGWRVRLMGTIQIALILGFTVILTARLPEFWLHPFGPLTKNVPLLAATLVMMALEE